MENEFELGSTRWPSPHWPPRTVPAFWLSWQRLLNSVQLLETRPQQYAQLDTAPLRMPGEGDRSRRQSQRDNRMVLRYQVHHTHFFCIGAAKTFCFHRITMLKTNIEGTKWVIKTLERCPSLFIRVVIFLLNITFPASWRRTMP